MTSSKPSHREVSDHGPAGQVRTANKEGSQPDLLISKKQNTSRKTAQEKDSAVRRRAAGIESEDDSDETAASLLAPFQMRAPGNNSQAKRDNLSFADAHNQTSTRGVQPVPSSKASTVTLDKPSVPITRPKKKSGRISEPGSRCDTCILQRRGCDGVRPVCGRCISIGKDCKWHDEYISRLELEKSMRNKMGGTDIPQPRKRKADEMDVRSAIDGGSTRASSLLVGETFRSATSRVHREEQIAKLKAAEKQAVSNRSNSDLPPFNGTGGVGSGDRINRHGRGIASIGDRRRTVDNDMELLDTISAKPVTDRWTYDDHLDMLNTLSRVRLDPRTGKQVFGHDKGNKIFDNTTSAMDEFDQLDDEHDAHRFSGLKLIWDKMDAEENSTAHAACSSGGIRPTKIRERLGMAQYSIPRVGASSAGGDSWLRGPKPSYAIETMPLAKARDDLSWMAGWTDEPRAKDVEWDDGGRLPKPNETADFDWCRRTH